MVGFELADELRAGCVLRSNQIVILLRKGGKADHVSSAKPGSTRFHTYTTEKFEILPRAELELSETRIKSYAILR